MAFLRQDARVVERFRIIEVAESESVTEAARRFGCSRTTVYKLVCRYRQGGLRALMNQPRGPREPIPEEVVELVVELKTCAPHRATSKVRQLLSERYGIGLSRQSIWRVLSARGLARIMDPEPLVRFERPQPNAPWRYRPMERREAVRRQKHGGGRRSGTETVKTWTGLGVSIGERLPLGHARSRTP